MTLLYDRATIKGNATITPEGYFVADALVARANNIQDYRASELGLTDRDPSEVVRVFRPEAEVFAPDSLASAVRLPITLDHPVQNGKGVMVDARNWREFTRGQTGDDVMRDGEFMRVPLRVTDGPAVASVQTDRQEFSLGYDCKLHFEAGTFNGQAYDAVATDLRYNHLAACRTARGGPQLRIVDERPAHNGGSTMEIVMVDGFAVDAANPAIAKTAIENLRTARDTATAALDEATKTVGARDATIAAKDAEISNLKDQVANSASPQALRDAAASYARSVNKAKALGAPVTDAMDEATVIATAVKHKLGDKAAAYKPEQFSAAFDALEAPAGALGAQPRDALAAVIGDGAQSMGDAATEAAKARDARMARYANAHEGRKPASAQ
jgi:hypothetical protein